MALSLTPQVAVIYVPLLQGAFDRMALVWSDWLFYTLVESSVLWLREVSKLVANLVRRGLGR